MGKQWKAGVIEDSQAAVAAVRELLKQIAEANSVVPRRSFPPNRIRMAAKKFKAKTSTGSDHWTFTEIILMPDAVLTSLGELLSDIQYAGIPPLQMMTKGRRRQ